MPFSFKYKEDEQYFADKLAYGNIDVLEKKFSSRFDFRSPTIKRAEYNALKNKLFFDLTKKANGICQICKLAQGTQIDHIIPIASNQLNKKFRHMRPTKVGNKLKKVPSESYGSNNLTNLQLACRSCNRTKWHAF